MQRLLIRRPVFVCVRVCVRFLSFCSVAILDCWRTDSASAAKPLHTKYVAPSWRLNVPTANLSNHSSFMFLFPSGPNTVAEEITQNGKQYGAFTWNFVQACTEESAEIETVFDQASRATIGGQRPWLHRSNSVRIDLATPMSEPSELLNEDTAGSTADTKPTDA